MSVAKADGFRVVVVDDDAEMRESLVHLLQKVNWNVTALSRGEDVHDCLQTATPDVILCDVQMSGMSGLDVLKSLSNRPAPPVVLISAHGDIPMAVKAMSDGAYSFLEKPFDPRRLLTVLRHAAEKYRLQLGSGRLKQRLASLSGLDRIFLGDAQSIKDLREAVIDLSETDAPVMVLGDTGTGKGVVAQALHDLSPRSAGPFIAIDCATVPVARFEDMLFGSEPGEPGALARADGGTLFLDEVATFPLEAQAKLLRVLETREFLSPVRSQPERVDIRVLSASNEDLRSAVAEGRFREDLFYRLHVIPIHMPALKERDEDVLAIADKLLSDYANEEGKPFKGFDAKVRAVFRAYPWPGNVRQLQNVVRNIVVLNDGELVDSSMLPAPLDQLVDNVKPLPASLTADLAASQGAHHPGVSFEHAGSSLMPARKEDLRPLDEMERQIIEYAIELCDGNVPQAASRLGISASTIYRKRQNWEEKLDA